MSSKSLKYAHFIPIYPRGELGVFVLRLFLIFTVLSLNAYGDVMVPNVARSGIVTTKIGPVKDNAYGVAVQNDGKIVAVGASQNHTDADIAVLRYLASGKLDISFGDHGVALFDSKLGDDIAYGVEVAADGKLLVVGSVSNGKNLDFVVLRFLTDGTLDPSFGRKGVTRVDFGFGDDSAYSVAIQDDQKIVVGGYASNGKDLDFAVARLEHNGLLDLNFGRNGKTITAFGDRRNRGTEEKGYSVLLQHNSKILLSGYSRNNENSVFITMRYHENGILDKTFGIDGTVVTAIGNSQDRAYASALQQDGRILVAGSSAQAAGTQFAIVRYLPNGIQDPAFGVGGIVRTAIGQSEDVIYAIAESPAGNIVAGGSFYNGSDMDFAVARYLPSGELDRTFGKNGKAIGQVDWKYSAAYGMAIQPDGKAIAAGVSSPGVGFQVALARYLPTGQFDPEFGISPERPAFARNRTRTSITAEIGLPSVLFKALLPNYEE